MSETLFLTVLFLVAGTILLVFGMKYVSAAYAARARAAGDGASRELAEKAVTAQSESAAALGLIHGELADVKARLASVEKILKDVG